MPRTKKPLEQKFPTGVIEDTRPAEEKAKDFKAEELFAAPPTLDWISWETWRVRPENIKLLETISVQNQNGSYSCLAQAGSLALAINNWNEEGKYRRMSPRSIYPYRRNKPDKGMWADDLGNLLIKKGVVFEDLLLSEGKNEDQMNDLGDFLPSFETVAKIYKAKNYLWLTPNSIDQVAGVLNQEKPVVIALVFGDNEWAVEVPVISASTTPYGHGITALPKAFFMYGNKKAILIQDSWGIKTGMLGGRRVLTEDWFTQGRVKAAIWFEDLNNLAVANISQEKPKYVFSNALTLGSTGNEVAMLQRCLGYLKDNEGYLFPLTIAPTGYYGGITRNAVKRFQVLYNLTITGNVDPATVIKLNEIFA